MLSSIIRRPSFWSYRVARGHSIVHIRTLTVRPSNPFQSALTQAEVGSNNTFPPTTGPRPNDAYLLGSKESNNQNSTETNPARSNGFAAAVSQLPAAGSSAVETNNEVIVPIDGKSYWFSPLLLRDLCGCQKCRDPSSRQKNFLTVDIPANIRASSVQSNDSTVEIKWENDIPGFDGSHVSEFDLATLRNYVGVGSHKALREPQKRVLWDTKTLTENVEDIDYEAYMEDDLALYHALQQLHAYGLMFLVNVPDTGESVSKIAERIGPLKNSFYGWTWDVRSVPQAKNVAYTSQDLGFHMDLLYLHQPPHLQLLHCIRSSSLGGASLFTDSFRAVGDLYEEDSTAFQQLVDNSVHFHYDHPTQQYRRCRQVIETKDPNRRISPPSSDDSSSIIDQIDAVSWSPPFQAPFALPLRSPKDPQLHSRVGDSLAAWHSAANKFNTLIHRPEMIHDRLMKPGECGIFDNRRVLHARRAFDVGDAGKERWLRGAYIDRDPYESKLWLLEDKYGNIEG